METSELRQSSASKFTSTPVSRAATWTVRAFAWCFGAIRTGEGIDVESRIDWPTGGRSLDFRDPDGHVVKLKTSNWRGRLFD